MMRAKNILRLFIGMSKTVYKVKYGGENLYNIILQTYCSILVNNMICETLSSMTPIAKMYIPPFHKQITV